MYDMPTLNMETLKSVLTDDEFVLVSAAFKVKKGEEKTGQLLASRPAKAPGKSQYIWRQLAFYLSKRAQHQCIPVMDSFYLYDDIVPQAGEFKFEAANRLAKELDLIVDKVLALVPAKEQHGLMRWGQALGVIGTPRLNDEGAVIYRNEE